MDANLKAVTSDLVWIDASVTMHDRTRGLVNRWGVSEDAHLMSRAIGLADTVARLNATVCADQVLRLYRRAGNASAIERSYFPGRRVSKSARGSLESGRLGSKVAGWASQSGDIEEVSAHPVLTLLQSPNLHETATQYAFIQYYDWEIVGKTYEHVVVDGSGAPYQLRRLAPHRTTVIPDAVDFIAGYWYGRDSSNVIKFAPDEVLFYRLSPNPENPFDSSSWFRTVQTELDLLIASAEYDKRFASNGQRPDYVLKVPTSTSDAQIEAVYAAMETRLRGINKAGQILVVRDAEIQTPQFTPKDLQSLEKVQHYERRIRNAGGWTESMADLNDANLASAKAGFDRQYLGATIRPRVNTMAEQRTAFLLPMFDMYAPDYFFAYDDPVPDAVENLSARLVAQVSAGLLTIDEARGELGYEPVPGGGVLRVGGQSVDRLDAPPIPMPMPPGVVRDDPGAGGSSDRTSRDDGSDTPPRKAGVGGDAGKGHTCGGTYRDPWHHPECGCKAAPPPSPEEVRQSAALAERLERVYGQALSRLAGGGQLTEAALATEVESAIFDAVLEVMTQSAREAGQGVALDLVDANALRIAREYVPQLAGNVARSTLEYVQGAVARGIDEGMSAREVANAIEGAGFSAQRAEAIARTETARAQGLGKLSGWEAQGFTSKIWLLANGPCPMCEGLVRDLEGKSIGLAEPFATAGQVIIGSDGKTYTVGMTALAPPLHPNCRCAVDLGDEDQ